LFDTEILELTTSLRQALDHVGIPYPEKIQWNPTPFRGRWGLGTAVAFQAASPEGTADDVPKRAQEIAALAAEAIVSPAAFELVQAEKAYINAYFRHCYLR